MALTRLNGANAITGTIPQGNIANASLGAVTALPAAIATGKVLQVVQGTHGTSVSISGSSDNTTVSDTGLTANITPSSSSNKILVLVQQSLLVRTGSNPYYGALSLMRDSTGIGSLGNILYTNASGDFRLPTANFSVYDSPNTTSQITYKTTFSLGYSASGTVYVQYQSNVSRIQLLEIAA